MSWLKEVTADFQLLNEVTEVYQKYCQANNLASNKLNLNIDKKDGVVSVAIYHPIFRNKKLEISDENLSDVLVQMRATLYDMLKKAEEKERKDKEAEEKFWLKHEKKQEEIDRQWCQENNEEYVKGRDYILHRLLHGM